MSAMVLYGTRRRNPGDPTVLRDKWLPSLKFFSSKKVAEVITKSVHQNSRISEEPWKTHQWQTARKHLCRNLVPSLLKDLHKEFLKYGHCTTNTCIYCYTELKNILGFSCGRLSKVQEMLMDWLCDPGWNPAYVMPRRFVLKYDSDLLSLDNLYVTHTSLCFPGDFKELLLVSLPKMLHLQDISLKYWEESDGDAFDLLAKHCHLKKFELRIDNLPFTPINKMLKFFQSQSHCLQDVTFLDSFCMGDDDPEHVKMIWNALAELRHLTKLEWFSSSLIRVSGERQMKPLQRLHTLKLIIEREHQSIDKIPVERMFPELEEYWLLYKFGNIEPLSQTRNLRKVTIVHLAMFSDQAFESIPANFVELFPSLRIIDSCLEVIPEQLKVSNLTTLVWGKIESLSFDQLKAPFWTMPNLIKCALSAKKVSNYDEKKFIKFLSETVHLRKKLKTLFLEIEQHPVNMTSATACSILRYSQIETFAGLSKFKFSSVEMEEFESLARQKYLTILPGYKNGRDIHSCDSGKHNSYYWDLILDAKYILKVNL